MSLRSVLRRLVRAIGDAGLTIGISRGTTSGRGGQVHTDHLLARAALYDEGARGYDADSANAGLLGRVPGWLVLLVFAIILAAVVILTSWQR